MNHTKYNYGLSYSFIPLNTISKTNTQYLYANFPMQDLTYYFLIQNITPP